jgi:hypothetical protein
MAGRAFVLGADHYKLADLEKQAFDCVPTGL